MMRRFVVALTLAAMAVGLTGCLHLVRTPAPVGRDGTVIPTESGLPGTSSVTPSASPLPLAGKVRPPRKGAYLGVYSPPAPFDAERIDTFEKRVGKRMAIVMWYQPWAPDNRYRFDSGACAAVMRRGKVPLITWEPWDPGDNANLLRDAANQPAYRLSAIASGKYDAYIRTWARDIKRLGGPVMLRPLHEMNGFWYPWGGTANGNTPAQYRAAWRRIHGIFQREGATNVTWVWSVNHESVPDEKGNRYADYYPGDRYVDWTAISGFNWGTASPYTRWRSWSHWYEKPLAYLKTLRKPICIAEFATVEQGGDKAAWIRDAYRRIPDHPGVKAVVYYDSTEKGRRYTQDWRVETSRASLAAFRRSISPGYYVGDAPHALRRWTGSLSDSDLRQLTSFRGVY